MLSVLKPYGIKCAELPIISTKANTSILKEIVAKVGLPCFVKPNKSGSSFGISKVKTEAELTNCHRNRIQRRQRNHHRKFP